MKNFENEIEKIYLFNFKFNFKYTQLTTIYIKFKKQAEFEVF